MSISSSTVCDSPNAEPNVDLGWRHGDTAFVAEVESLTAASEAMQMRPGLGRENGDMAHGPGSTVEYRLWPPFAIALPLLAGWLATLAWGDPVELGSWRVPVGWALVLFFLVWNGWSLWLFGRHRTGLLPGQSTNAIIEEGPFRLSRNPLYVGLLALYVGLALLAPTVWGLLLFPGGVLLIWWGAIRPEERYLHERFGALYDGYARRVRRWL